MNTIDILLGNGQYTNFNVNPVMEKDGSLIEPHRYQKNDGSVFEKGIFGYKKAIVEIHGTTGDGDDEIIAKTAEVLGNLTDQELYEDKAQRVKEAFHENRECYDSNTSIYGSGSQSSWGCVLYSGIVLEENIATALEGLVHAVEKSGYHLTSGEVGLKQVFSVLNKYGRDDIVYKMVTNNTPPSYKHFVDCGLTTLPEYWNYEELWYGMVRSRNHAMMGHVREWFVHAVLGIRTAGDGYKKIRIQPFIPENTSRAKGGFVCGLGRISVEWRLTGDKEIMIKAEIPDGVHAEITTPEGYVLKSNTA